MRLVLKQKKINKSKTDIHKEEKVESNTNVNYKEAIDNVLVSVLNTPIGDILMH